MPAATIAPAGAPCLVLVGASNLHLGLLPFAAALDRALGSAGLVLVTAPGAGRSYGKPAGVLAIQYPGHLESSLVDYVRALPVAGPRIALCMDIGNDLGYGEPPELVLSWVEAYRDQLRGAGCTVLLQRPPLESIRRIPPVLFDAARRLYFPRSSLGRDELLRRVEVLDTGLSRLAPPGDVLPSVAPFAGPDGIHVVPWNLPAFWDGLGRDLAARVGHPSPGFTLGARSGALARGLLSRTLKPRRYARFGRWRESSRYEVRLPGGTTLVRL